MAGKSVLHLELKGDAPEAADVFSELGNVATVSIMSGKNGGTVEFNISIRGDRDIREDVFRTAVDKGWTILEMHLQENNLEDVFRNLTKSQGA